MSKKSRKARKPNVPMYTGPMQPAEAAAGPTTSAKSVARVVRSASGSETINADYTHVMSDLRRIGILAGLLIAALIALSFIIK